MVENKKTQAQDPEVVIESTISKFEFFLEKNGRSLLIALGVLILLAGAFFAYKYLYASPRAQKAATAMYQAQMEFERDSFALALNGNSSFDGFLSVADQFGSTPQGNLANHYAGLCYLNMGQFQEAINSFKEFSSVDGALGIIISAQNIGLMGDAYVELGDMQQGVAMYEKAAAYSDNEDTAPTYLKKAGMVNESLGNNTKALEQYKTIKNVYGATIHARDIDKFIARVEQGL